MSDSESRSDNELPFIDSMRLNGEVDIMLKESIRQPNLELEWIYGDPHYPDKHTLTKELFIDLKHKLDSSIYSTIDETNSLDIRCEFRNKGQSIMSNIRATLESVQQIKQYCLQDNFDDLTPTFMSKTRYKDPKNPTINYGSAGSGMYPCRINLKQEIPKEPTSNEVGIFLNKWSSKNKFFRYKKRFSYVSVNKLWRIDLTAIKSSDQGKSLNQYTYSKTFRESDILNKNETFELEIEYIGSISNTFAPPPIIGYADNLNVSPFNLTEGNVFTADVSFTNDEETQELYTLDSPRYDEGIEFDEPNDAYYSPRQLSDIVHIKPAYWKDTKQEDIFKLISKGVEVQEWVHQEYKFIPRMKRFIHRDDRDVKRGDYLDVEISPHLVVKGKQGEEVLSNLLIPMRYIVETVSDYDPAVDEFSPDSPRQRGGGQGGGQGGGGGFNVSSNCYSQTILNHLLKDLESIIHFCYSIIVQTEYYLDELEQSSVIMEYITLSDPQNIHHKRGWKFVGPQPVSMGIQHLNPLNPHSVVSQYVVTEKADGVRAQLLITKDGRGYLITPKKRVIDTGVSFEGITGSWILDGEYITQNKGNEPIRLFMIFDVYYSTDYKEQPFTYPWSAKTGISRSGILHKFKNDIIMNIDDTYPESAVRIGFKQYLAGPDKLTKKKGSDTFSNLMGIFKSTKKILNIEDKGDGFEYFTDGLIFLPMFLPVKAMDKGEKVKSIRGTWPLNYKWKPPEENTIDFKVIFSKEQGKAVTHSYTYTTEGGKMETQYYQKVQLVVGYKEKDDDSIDFNWSILTKKPLSKQSYQFFDPPTHTLANVHLTNIPLHGKKMKCEKDGKDIKNGAIIEMRYNDDSKEGFTWTPLRVRDDKEQPQYFTVANNIWKTINEPVTKEMIKGSINFDELKDDVETTDKYYVDTKFAEDEPIRDLHNYIKSKLISRIGSSTDHKGGLMIADLSCGRGGDIKKYLSIRNKVEFIMGLDISSNVNEAAQRFHYLTNLKPKALFIQYDTSLSIEKGEGCLVTKDKEKQEICSDMLDMVLGRSKTFHKRYKDIQKQYLGLAKGGFDIVSSQFSLHYYFKDEETLRGFCENVQYMCADDGYFIGTCYDGMKVMKTFAKEDTDTLEMIDGFGSLIYQIKKKYSITDFSYDKGNLEDMFGQEIEVFMASIGQPITEYLVNFEFFIDLMKEYGFEPVLPTYRKGEYNPIKSPIDSFDTIIDNVSEVREKDNNFVKKTYNTGLYNVPKKKGYSLLSGLNNWFIFQKK